MRQPYRGKPRSTSRFVLPGGRSAVLIPRERTHFSKLQKGYPLAEEYLNYLATEGVDAVVIDDGDRLFVFDLHRYRRGNRVGHAPYPMKRVLPLEDAATTLHGDQRESEKRAAEWEWLTDEDLHPPRHERHSPSSSTSQSHSQHQTSNQKSWNHSSAD